MMEKKPKVPFGVLARNFLAEIFVYGVLLVAYFFVALRYLSEPLTQLFGSNLVAYAFIGLGLIVAQAVFLEFVTSLLFDFLGLHRLTK
jgi:hypothetical protein